MAGSKRHTEQVSQLNRQVSELQQELLQLKRSQSGGSIRVDPESGFLDASSSELNKPGCTPQAPEQRASAPEAGAALLSSRLEESTEQARLVSPTAPTKTHGVLPLQKRSEGLCV